MENKEEKTEDRINEALLKTLEDSVTDAVKKGEALAQKYQQLLGDHQILQQLYGESQIAASKYQSVTQQLSQQNSLLSQQLKTVRTELENEMKKEAKTPDEKGEETSPPSESSETK